MNRDTSFNYAKVVLENTQEMLISSSFGRGATAVVTTVVEGQTGITTVAMEVEVGVNPSEGLIVLNVPSSTTSQVVSGKGVEERNETAGAVAGVYGSVIVREVPVVVSGAVAEVDGSVIVGEVPVVVSGAVAGVDGSVIVREVPVVVSGAVAGVYGSVIVREVPVVVSGAVAEVDGSVIVGEVPVVVSGAVAGVDGSVIVREVPVVLTEEDKDPTYIWLSGIEPDWFCDEVFLSDEAPRPVIPKEMLLREAIVRQLLADGFKKDGNEEVFFKFMNAGRGFHALQVFYNHSNEQAPKTTGKVFYCQEWLDTTKKMLDSKEWNKDMYTLYR